MLARKPQSFGEWLRQRREQRDLTQSALAEQADCSFSTICKLETGGRRPSQTMAVSLMKVLNVPEDERPALMELARSRQGINNAGAQNERSASYASRRAALAKLGGEIGQDVGANLPAPRTTFIGREQEVLALRTILRKDGARLITLLGPPGIGKTRLSLQVAQSMSGHFPGGVVFAFLSPVTDYRMVMPEVAKALGLSWTPGLSALEILKASLGDKRMLLVLDNFEQVVQAGPEVGELLDACPGLKIMVASRTALEIYGENLFAVKALAMPSTGMEVTARQAPDYAAIALFEQRSRAANSSFRLNDENVSAVAEICRRLDGLPLAIELAAARTENLAPSEILSRLGHGSDLLDSGPSDLPARQRSLAGAIDWSYDLLDEDEARLFRWMSVFVAAPALEAIEFVCGGSAGECGDRRPVFELVSSLVGKSLVYRLESCDDEARYYLLQTIREYALERLAESEEEDRAKERHALYYASLLSEVEPHLHGGERDAWAAGVDSDYPHILEALAWCKAHPEHIETGLQTAWALKWYWGYRNYFSEGRGWLADLIAVADEAGIPRESYHRAKALSALGEFSLLFFDYDALTSQLGEAVELWRALGNNVELAHAMACLGAGLAHENLAPEGKALVEEAVGILREANDPTELAYALTWLADMHKLAQQWDQARTAYNQALDLYRGMGDTWRGAANLSALGYLALRAGDYTEARRCYSEALAAYKSANNRWNMAAAYRGLGDVELSEDRLQFAGSCYEESLRLYKLHNDRLRAAMLYRNLGYVELQKGHYSGAFSYFAGSVDGLQAIGHRPSVVLCIAAFTSLAVAQGRITCAARLSSQVDDSREQLVTAMSAIDLAIYDRSLARARKELGEAAFQAACAEGRRMSLDKAVEYAKANCEQKNGPRGRG
jgi:predicted ATPase/transcriptional regulator with XRE-family HTH domain